MIPAAGPKDTSPVRAADLRAFRTDYVQGELNEADVLPDPIDQFSRWFKQAKDLPEPNAMTLATADASGAPSARIVLLKEFDEKGFVFFTNYDSRKGREMAENARAALLFFWQPLERQVRIEGAVERTSRAMSEAYFHSRPPGAQIGAWVSRQSQAICSREELQRLEEEFATKFAGGPIPLPDYWGGYRIIPQSMEFWQGRASRLHDRLRYTRSPGGEWTLQRLSP